MSQLFPEPVALALRDLGLSALDASRGELEPHVAIDVMQRQLERVDLELRRWLARPDDGDA